MENLAIRKAAKAAKVPLWMIAEALGIADFSFSRKLRRELHKAEQEKILEIIQKISTQGDSCPIKKAWPQAASASAKSAPGRR